MEVSHFNFDGFGRIDITTMSSSLFDKFLPMGKNQGLSGNGRQWLDTVDEMSEYDLVKG